MTKFKEWQDADVNVFVGGTPCQSFSVAGLRKGLDDPRGNLMLTYLAIADKYKPQWIVWENVPGVLSSNGGKDFGIFLGALGELGYGFAYRILDAQYFGVAQRRRRVFVVGYLGNWRPAAAVLFERHSLSGHPAPSRKAREGVAANARESPSVGSLCARTGQSISVQDAEQGHLMPAKPQWWDGGDLAATITTKSDNQRMPDKANAQLVMQPIALAENTIGRKPENGGNGDGFTEEGPMYTLNATGVHGVAQPMPINTMVALRHEALGEGTGFGIGAAGDPAYTITKGHSHAVAQPVGTDIYNGAITGDVAVPLTNRSDGTGTGPTVMQAMAVRRLTPKECERLQGFPDNYTDIKPKGKATPDGPRYKALGNSMAVPVMAWIGKRIQEVDAICQTQKQ
jgi:DNA (cytosine-5)-methyltransferase 1